MGVPKFYRWLSERYPLVNQAIDESTLLPEFDNLYLDMNGSIHNATHGNEGITRKLSEKEVMLSILAAVDHAVKLVKPRKLLYMAVDGVAPRAKMNQQRSRRFRAARDAAEAREQAKLRGEEVDEEDIFDSNCITPGTEFMTAVSAHMRYFIRRKLKEDPLWQGLRVVFSGHEVPGEGEHKIVSFIRAAKMRPGWDPDTRHCMAGLDADLIMLSLATHEPHFSLLREQVRRGRRRRADRTDVIDGQSPDSLAPPLLTLRLPPLLLVPSLLGGGQVDFNAFRANKFGTKTTTRETAEKRWQLLHVGLLREYLEIDMRPTAVRGGCGGGGNWRQGGRRGCGGRGLLHNSPRA
jgi:5'-3' exonuclease